MYRKTVVEFHLRKYSKLSEDVLRGVFPPERELASAHQKVWICSTCNSTLKKGKMPAQAKANNLGLEDIPHVLLELNNMETRLISMRIAFMKHSLVADSERSMDLLSMCQLTCIQCATCCQGYHHKPR